MEPVTANLQELKERLSRFPRADFLEGPTLLQRLPRLSAMLGERAPMIWAKRDDAISLGMGGNKVRVLEYLVGDALAQGCDTLITCGAVQSNHCRLTAAAANKAGLRCELLLVDRVVHNDPNFRRSGNRLLVGVFGATVHDASIEVDKDLDGAMNKIAAGVKARGGKPYIVPEGGGSPTGGLGYVTAALELTEQAAEKGIVFKDVFVASGSGGTHGGFVAGSLLLEAPWQINGICVRRDAAAQYERVSHRVAAILQLLGYETQAREGSVLTSDKALGRGYGQLTEAVHEAVALTARTEGLLLDPVYTGKVMAALIEAVRDGRFGPEDNILFIHTGGAPALFAYLDAMEGQS